MRPKLPYIDLLNWKGLNTKSSNDVLEDTQLRDAKNTDLFTQYGALSKPPGSSRVLSATYKEGGNAKQLSWVGFYKASGLDGQILRKVLVASGTVISELDGSSLTALTGAGKSITEARTEGLFATDTMFRDFLLITNQDPDLAGNGNTLVKYDGVDITRWGVIAPGTEETIQDTFDNAGSWTISGGTIANESTVTLDGDSATVTKTSTSQTNVSITKTLSSTFSVDTTIADRGQVSLFIPRGQFTNLAENTTVQILIGSDATLATNFYTFNYDIGELLEGWQQIAIDFSSPDSTTGSPVATALQTVRFTVNSDAIATLFSNIRWDKFLIFDKGAPVAAEGAAPADPDNPNFPTGNTYQYKVTYVTKYEQESNAGPASVTLTLAADRDSILLTEIPVSPDSQVIARKIYRPVSGGTIFLFVDRINDNTTTTFTDTTVDTGLGQTSPPLAGDLNDDNSPPPQAGIVQIWKDTVFMAGDPLRPQSVFFSEVDDGESFPLLNTVTLDDKVTGIYETYSGLVIETELGKWQVTGANPDYRFDKIISNIGCVGRRAAGKTRIVGWAVDRDGMRFYDLNNPIKISEVIRDKFETTFNKQNIELMHTMHSKNRNAILMFVADSSGEYKGNNYVYQYPEDRLFDGWWWQLDIPSSINLLHGVEIEDDNGDFHTYFGAEDGMLYELFDPNATDWVLVDGTAEAITTTFQTKWLRPGEMGQEMSGVTGRVIPRFIEARKEGDDCQWTCVVDTANGPEQPTPTESKTVTLDFQNNQNLIRSPIPAMQAGEYVRFQLTNNQEDKDVNIIAVRLFFAVTGPTQFPLEGGQMNG
jgi:hypothetical protein